MHQFAILGMRVRFPLSAQMERATVKETGLPAKQIVRFTGLGSEPSLSAKTNIGRLCNGSIAVSKTVGLGSSPSRPANWKSR